MINNELKSFRYWPKLNQSLITISQFYIIQYYAIYIVYSNGIVLCLIIKHFACNHVIETFVNNIVYCINYNHIRNIVLTAV